MCKTINQMEVIYLKGNMTKTPKDYKEDTSSYSAEGLENTFVEIL
jgi:hypothetical protein